MMALAAHLKALLISVELYSSLYNIWIQLICDASRAMGSLSTSTTASLYSNCPTKQGFIKTAIQNDH
jgi:hypothetical protein